MGMLSKISDTQVNSSQVATVWISKSASSSSSVSSCASAPMASSFFFEASLRPWFFNTFPASFGVPRHGESDVVYIP